MIRPFLGILTLLLLLAIAGSGFADERRGGEQGISEMTLGILEQAGVKADSASLLAALRSHRDPMIRGLAADVLGQRKEGSARGALLQTLKGDPDRLVRESAALALARMGEDAGFSALREFMASPSNQVRQVFLAARLAELGDLSGYPYVCKAAKSKSSSLRELAVPALVPFFSLKSLPASCDAAPEDLFLGLARDESAKARHAALLYLPMAVDKGLSLEQARAVAMSLAHSDPDPRVREEADAALGSLRAQEERRKPESREP